MNWQESVMDDNELGMIYLSAEDYRWGDSIDHREVKEMLARRAIAKAQAEIAYKDGQQDGRKEVVEFIDASDFGWAITEYADWQDKLKEWEIK